MREAFDFPGEGEFGRMPLAIVQRVDVVKIVVTSFPMLLVGESCLTRPSGFTEKTIGTKT